MYYLQLNDFVKVNERFYTFTLNDESRIFKATWIKPFHNE